ncbi:MAG: hypothetical protein PHU54_09005 [Candidatus Omnitrophica bacterium]|jgi:transposase-like protein|nr:hypothetical protein [Candidatus Omnitrophota bacterium]
MKKNSKNTRSYEARDPKAKAKEKGRHKINNAIRDGRMKKPKKCPNCGSTTGRIEWDHQGDPPGWKCSKCHKRGPGA